MCGRPVVGWLRVSLKVIQLSACVFELRSGVCVCKSNVSCIVFARRGTLANQLIKCPIKAHYRTKCHGSRSGDAGHGWLRKRPGQHQNWWHVTARVSWRNGGIMELFGVSNNLPAGLGDRWAIAAQDRSERFTVMHF